MAGEIQLSEAVRDILREPESEETVELVVEIPAESDEIWAIREELQEEFASIEDTSLETADDEFLVRTQQQEVKEIESILVEVNERHALDGRIVVSASWEKNGTSGGGPN